MNEHGVRYVLIGGFAVIAYGAGRTTRDIDFLVDASVENVSRIKAALAILADNAAVDIADTDVQSYSVVRVADEVIVDLLGSACGVDYAEAAVDQVRRDIRGVDVPIASKRTLIRTKDTVRPSDAVDKQFLEALIDAEEREQ